MDDIRSSTEINTEGSSSTLSAEALEETPLVGELAGLKITEEEHSKNFSSLTNEEIGRVTFLDQRGSDVPLHSFVQVHPSMESLATENTSSIASSPALSQRQLLDFKGIDIRCSLLKEKIKVAEEGLFSFSQKTSHHLEEGQERYVNNLQSILKVMEDISIISVQKTNSIEKITSAVDAMIKVAEDLKIYRETEVANRVEGKERSYTGAAGEAAESLLYYIDYVADVKKDNLDNAPAHLCLAKKCFSKFKLLEAQESSNKEEEQLFYNAFSCYQEALERSSFGDETLEEAGDSFFSAAITGHNGERQVSELYKQAGTFLRKANEVGTSRVRAEELYHQQVSNYWILSGNNTLNAICALQSKKAMLFHLYDAAQQCFQRIAEKLSLIAQDSEMFEAIKALDQAGNRFVYAAEAIEEGFSKLAFLHQFAGRCQREKADAIFKKNNEALSSLEKAEQLLPKLFSFLEEEASTPVQGVNRVRFQSLADAYYMAGRALVKEEQKIPELCFRAAECWKEVLNSATNSDRAPFLEKAARCYREAAIHVETKQEEAALFYTKAGNLMNDAAKADDKVVATVLVQAADAYLSMVQENKKNSEQHNSVIQLLKSVAKYSEIAAKELESFPAQDKDIAAALGHASLNLMRAAESLKLGNQELADAYEHCATSYYYFAVANKPSLVKHLPLSMRLSFQENSIVSDSVKEYWKQAIVDNNERIKQLLCTDDAL